jgi:hypothetical protein
MSLTELVPAARALRRAEKLQLVRLLVNDLAEEEGLTRLESGASYPIWSPLEAYDAAQDLLQALESKQAKR